MPRIAKPTERVLADQSLVIDNGGYSIKAGFVNPHPKTEDCQTIPNCLAKDRSKRVWVGSQLDKCSDFGEIAFRRPVEKGFIVNWEAQKAIWDNIFIGKNARLYCDPHTTNLLLGEAPNTPVALQKNCDEIVFEEYEFSSYSRHLSPSFNAYNDIQHLYGAPAREPQPHVIAAECLLVIDSGFSHSTVSPIFKGRPIQQAIRRLDIGGKFLTNYLQELISIRHFNMVDEPYTVNEVKEAISFVSQDFKRDLERSWKGSSAKTCVPRDGEEEIVVDYVLPDYNAQKKGFMRKHDPSLGARLKKIQAGVSTSVAEEVMTLANERFTVPELLFNPGDVGMKREGLAGTVMQSLSGLPPGLWPAMLANILVVGGNSKMEGFMNRLEMEIRQLAPTECTVRIARAPDPVKFAWLGGAALATDRAALKRVQVTRQEYQEHGSSWLGRIFMGNLQR